MCTRSDPDTLPSSRCQTTAPVFSFQASLKFIEQRGVAAIPKASTAEYQAENLDLAGFTLTESDMVALGSMANPNRRGGADGMGMMCIDTATGKMARCYYLD